jgi:tetratricopeptide (TPR) repeat protein
VEKTAEAFSNNHPHTFSLEENSVSGDHLPSEPLSPKPAEKVFSFTLVKDKDFSLQSSFLQTLKDTFSATIFVETGTFLGNTSAKASEVFSEVHTVELSTDLYHRAVEKFKSQPSVFVYHGNSGNIFPQLLEKIKGLIIFWLDGHYSGGNTAKGEGHTPIIKELLAIQKSNIIPPIILIDDLRYFDQSFPHLFNEDVVQDYPHLSIVCKKILDIDPGYQFAVLGDILLAYPSTEINLCTPLAQACTISRLFEEGLFTPSEVLKAEREIILAEGLELEFLQKLYDLYKGEEQYGFCRHYRLWFALTLAGRGNYVRAYKEFLVSKILGLTHWRIDWYLACSAFDAGAAVEALEHLTSVIQAAPFFEPAALLVKNVEEITSINRLAFSVEDYLDLAVHYELANNTTKALEQLNWALKQNQDQTSILLIYVAKLIEVGQWISAEGLLKKIIELDPFSSLAYNELGVLTARRGDLGKAMEYYGTAFQLDQKNYSALRNLVRLAADMGLSEQARSIIQELLSKEGPLPILLDIESEIGLGQKKDN